MTMIELFEHRVQLAMKALVLSHAEDLDDDVGGQAEHAEFARALEDLMDRPGTSEDEIAAVFHLVQGVLASQMDGRPVLLREFRADDQRPVVDPRPNHLGTERVGGGLQGRPVADGEERVVVPPKRDSGSLQRTGDDVVPVEIVRRLKREERPDAENEGAEHLVANVEVVMRVPVPCPSQEAIVGIVGRVLRQPRIERRSRFHAFQDEIHPESLPAFEAGAVRADVVFSLQALGLQRLVISPLNGNPVVTSERVHPPLVLLRSLAQGLFRDRVDAVNVPEEMDDVRLPRQQRQIALNDDAIETAVYKDEQAAKQLVNGLHRSSPLMRVSATPSCARRLVETTPSIDSDRNARSTHSFITRGSALEIRRPPFHPSVSVPRDFKGRALGYG